MTFTSPTRGMAASMFLPISAGSTSMWMVAIRRWISLGSTMARSAARVPTMMSRSALANAWLAQWLPWAPIIPMFRGWSVGIREMPIMVLTTGMAQLSASSRSSSRRGPARRRRRRDQGLPGAGDGLHHPLNLELVALDAGLVAPDVDLLRVVNLLHRLPPGRPRARR